MLLLVQQFIENPALLLGLLSADPAVAAAAPSLPGVPGDVKLLFQVLSALGVGMMVWGVCWRLPIWAIATVGVVAMGLSRVITPDVSAFRSGTSFGVTYVVWAAVVAALYPACAAYARFKFAKAPTSLWRMF